MSSSQVLDQTHRSGPFNMDKTREEFIVFIREAIANRKSPAYKELYQYLVQCFVKADINKDGTVEV